MHRARPLVALSALLVTAACTSGTAGRSDAAGRPAPQRRTAAGAPSTATSGTATPTRSARTAPRRTAPAASTPRRVPSTPAPPISYSGLTVVLNPGHDGGNASHPAAINRQVPAGYGAYKACDTTGTNTNAGYPEHAFNWDVALRVRTILVSRGIHVVLTRPDDTGVGPCVDERASIGNRAGVAAVVSIHADGAPAAGHGFHVNQDSRRPDGASAATAARSIALGQALHAALERSSGLVPSTYIGHDGYYYRSDLAGLNLATRPASFLELGNMRNAADAALQSSPAGRQRIAAAVADGILAFLGQ